MNIYVIAERLLANIADNMELVIFIGIQATGKSTFFGERFADTHVRINLDMLRTKHRQRRLLETCIEIGQRCVVDNTNPTRKDRRFFIETAKTAGFRIVGFYFQSKVSEAIARNQLRADHKRVPDKAIPGTSARLELPAWDEGFEELYYVAINEKSDFIVEEWSDEI